MFWCFAGTAGVPALFLLGVNVWLATSPGRKWIAGKIGGKTGLQTDVGWSSVTPWSGVTIHKLSLAQPEALRAGVPAPLAEVERIRLSPVWKACLHGHLEVHDMDLDSPHITLPLELLAHLGAFPKPPHAVASQPPIVPQPPGIQPPVAQNPSPQQPPATAKPITPAAPSPPTGWIRLRNASFSLVTAGHAANPVIRIACVDGDIPAAGAAAESKLRIAEITCLRGYRISPPEIPLRWQEPELTFSESKWDLSGWKISLGAKCALRPGLPFLVEMLLPKQDGSWHVPSFARLETKITSGNAMGRFGGFAVAPSTWQGDFAVGTEKLTLPFQDHLSFEQTGVLLGLRSGIAACRDARAIGESASFLGNATVLADGRCAAVLRVVLHPDSARNIIERTNAILPGTSWGFAPMGAPDRLFADISAHGTLDHITVTLGGNGSALPLPQAAELLRQLAPHP